MHTRVQLLEDAELQKYVYLTALYTTLLTTFVSRLGSSTAKAGYL